MDGKMFVNSLHIQWHRNHSGRSGFGRYTFQLCYVWRNHTKIFPPGFVRHSMASTLPICFLTMPKTGVTTQRAVADIAETKHISFLI